MTQIKFRISNLTCAACIKLSTLALKKVPGVSDVQIDLETGNSCLEADRQVGLEEIRSALLSVGKNAVSI